MDRKRIAKTSISHFGNRSPLLRAEVADAVSNSDCTPLFRVYGNAELTEDDELSHAKNPRDWDDAEGSEAKLDLGDLAGVRQSGSSRRYRGTPVAF